MSSDNSNFWCEHWAAILMSLTALVTAWSAYQANLWTGKQSVELALALDAQTLLSQEVIASNQQRMTDGILSIEIARAVALNQPAVNDFIVPRVREEIKKPISDWLALDPLNNKNAPANPLLMPSYIEQVRNKAIDRQTNIGLQIKDHMQTAQNAGSTSDGYVLLTVLFATVLFFAGMATTFRVPRMQISLLFLATIVMCVSLFKLFALNIAYN